MTQAATTAPILAGRYRIEGRLGTNRLASVYRAFDERLHRPVLVHMLRKDLVGQEALRQRFLEEARSSARRSHQSLLELFDSGEAGNRPYMITEYVAGRTIRELGALSLEEALLYFRQLVGAIAACQAANVPHPPVSARNLMVVADGHVELVESWLTPPGEIALDLASYRPPERTQGQPATSSSVVYSLGLLLLEMLGGRRVIDGGDPRDVAQQHLNAHLPTLAQVRPALHIPPLEQIIARATARSPADRYSDAAALGHALDDLWRALNSETQRLGSAPVQRPKLRERINRAAAEVAAPRPVVTPQLPDVPDDELDLPQVRRQSRSRSLVGLGVLLVLFGLAAMLAYTLATAAIEQLSGIRLPSIGVNLPSIPLDLPEWLTGVISGGGEVYVVINAPDRLNVRENPGINTKVITALPNDTLVRKVGGPRNADGVDWIRVRARVGDQEVEGWVSLRYVQQVSNDA